LDKQSFSFPECTKEMRSFAYPKLALIKGREAHRNQPLLVAGRVGLYVLGALTIFFGGAGALIIKKLLEDEDKFNCETALLKQKLLQSSAKSKLDLTKEDLRSYGLNDGETTLIYNYYEKKKNQLDKLEKPTIIKRNDITPTLPRSLLYIPEGENKGMYVLLKQHHNTVKQIASGSDNRVTLAINLDTGEKKAFRSAKKEDIFEEEIQINKELSQSKYKDSFVTASEIVQLQYRGDWSPRKWSPDSKKEHNVEKIGFLIDYIEGGNLGEWLQKRIEEINTNPNATPQEKQQDIEIETTRVAWQYAEKLAHLHELGFVHYDQKSQNVLMTKNGEPKLLDFGLSKKIGDRAPTYTGNKFSMAPEIHNQDPQHNLGTHPTIKFGKGSSKQEEVVEIDANSAADIWGLGCILASIFYLNSNWSNDIALCMTEENLNNFKKENFNQDNPITNIMKNCLTLHPNKRPTAKDIANQLQKQHNDLIELKNKKPQSSNGMT
jgi:serine/threonine protein kinase